MAAGTTLAAVDASSNISAATPRPSSVLAIGARPPTPAIDFPDNNLFAGSPDPAGNVPKTKPWSSRDPFAFGNVVSAHSVTVRGVQDKCSGEASFALEVKSPRGGSSTARVLYEDEPRTTTRGLFDVRYRETGVNFSINQTGSTVVIASAAWVRGAVAVPVASAKVDWGDGTTPSGNLAVPGDRSHSYAVSGIYTITISATDDDGNVASASQTVTIP
jgi:hypothetical protein